MESRNLLPVDQEDRMSRLRLRGVWPGRLSELGPSWVLVSPMRASRVRRTVLHLLAISSCPIIEEGLFMTYQVMCSLLLR